MSLPAEIRRRIYAEALPPWDTYVHSTSWIEWKGGYLPSVILALNRQIFDEAIQVLYERDCAILSVTTSGLHFFDDWIFYGPVAYRLTLPDIAGLISNWQISVDSFISAACVEHQQSAPDGDSTPVQELSDGWRGRNLTRRVAECVKIMDLNKGIHTLIVKFPCVCSMECCLGLSALRHRFVFLSALLQSLKQLRVTVRCSFVAFGEKNIQCPESSCVALAEAFAGFKEVIEGKAVVLETAEERWLKLKQRTNEMSVVEIRQLLQDGWVKEELLRPNGEPQNHVSMNIADWAQACRQLVEERGKPPRWIGLIKPGDSEG
ncbi:MAG: hypothetical protein Q9218_007597 [Villophora microphyllina]